ARPLPDHDEEPHAAAGADRSPRRRRDAAQARVPQLEAAQDRVLAGEELRLAVGLAPQALQLALDLPPRVAGRDVAALVAQLLAARERELDLDAAAAEVEPRRDDREALLRDRRGQLLDLAPVEQELAWPVGIVVGAVPLRVLGHMQADEPGLAVAHLGVRLLQRRLTSAQRLHLRARAH